MRTPPDKRIIWTFYSHPVADVRRRWKAKLTFEPGSTDETESEIRIEDGCEEPIAAAVFEFAGVRIPIAAGVGKIRLADFIKGKHEPGVWLYRKGDAPVPGVLTFE